MTHEMPTESEGLGGIGDSREVNDESASLVEDFECTNYDLEDFAKHYLDKAKKIEFFARFLGYGGSEESRMLCFARRRLDTIENVLGKEKFQKSLSITADKWEKVFAQAEEIEQNLEPCKVCGGKRSYHDYVLEPDGYCSETCFEDALMRSKEFHLGAEELLPDFRPALYELEVLANHYLNTIERVNFNMRFHDLDQTSIQIFSIQRLATIKDVLGEEGFQKAIADTVEKWNKKFAEMEEFEANLEPCRHCGVKRDYYTDAHPDIPDGYCGLCGIRAKVALGEARFQKALASAEEEWDKIFAEVDEIERNLEPCNACGGKRDMYDYAHIPDGYCRACDPTVTRLNSGSVRLNATRKFRAYGGT